MTPQKPKVPFPRLQFVHKPGWRLQPVPDEDDLIVFDSEIVAFGLGFSLDVFRDGTMSSSLMAVHPMDKRKDLTADALADLGNETDLLQTWFDDLATVVAWADEHRAALAGLIPTSK